MTSKSSDDYAYQSSTHYRVPDHISTQSSLLPHSSTVPKRSSFDTFSASQTNYGRSPVSIEKNRIIFDYNIFVTTWQDQIRMKQYTNCEKYCKEVIRKLVHARDLQIQVQYEFEYDIKHGNNNKRGSRNSSKSMSTTMSNNNSSHSHKSRKKKKSFPKIKALNNQLQMQMNDYPYQEYQSKVHFSLAYLLKKYFKKYDEAKKQYEMSISTDKENPGAHFNLANMLVDHYKDVNTAQYHFEKAISLEPNYALYRMTYAEFLWHDCQRYLDSNRQYEELLKFTKDNEDIYFNYGLLLRDHLENSKKAKLQFQKAVDINPTDIEAQEELQHTVALLNQENSKRKNYASYKVELHHSSSSDNNQTLMYSSSSFSNKHTSLSLINDSEENASRNKFSIHSMHSKRASSARRSQAEILLPELRHNEESNCDISYALLYHEIQEEKHQLSTLLMLKSKECQKMENQLAMVDEQLNRMTPKLRHLLDIYVNTGVAGIEQNAANVHQILFVFKAMLNRMSMHMAIRNSGSEEDDEHEMDGFVEQDEQGYEDNSFQLRSLV